MWQNQNKALYSLAGKKFCMLILALLFFLVSLVLPLPAPKVSAELSQKQKTAAALNHCKAQIPSYTEATATAGRTPKDPAVYNHQIAVCAKGFLEGLKSNAKKPPSNNFSDPRGVCHTRFYQGDTDSAFFCEQGYIHAYQNRSSILNPTPLSEEEKRRVQLNEEARSQCVRNGGVPGGVTNREALLSHCQMGYKGAKNGKSKNEACAQSIGIEKQFCEKGFDLATASSAGGGDDESVNDIDCSGGGALGWIICPVFELGANMTQDVFDNIIRPMMEQVPVSTKGPFYAAWNNFRFLGNIVLIGAMLALVYAQARGGGR